MRVTRFRVFLLMGASLLVLGPAISLGQPGGFPGGFPGGPPGGPGMGRRSSRRFRRAAGGGGRQAALVGAAAPGAASRIDPNMIFNTMANGKDYLSVVRLPGQSFRDSPRPDRQG